MRSVGDIALDAEVRAIASGAITDGAPVLVNSDGTVSLASDVSATGTAVVFEADQVYLRASAVYDTNADRIVIAYQDSGNSYYGTAIVGTISGTSISFGSPVVFKSANTRMFNSSFDINASKIVIVYRDSNPGRAIVATVDPSDNSISFGSEATYDATKGNDPHIAYDVNAQKHLITYYDDDDDGRAIVGTVSGTSISFGSSAEFETDDTRTPNVIYDVNAQKHLIFYALSLSGGSDTPAKVRVATISGTSVSFGTVATVSTSVVDHLAGAYDVNAQKSALVYRDQTSSTSKARVATISGTDVSFGTEAEYDDNNATDNDVAYDASLQKLIFTFRDYGNSSKGSFKSGTISGTDITFGSTIVFEEGSTPYSSVIYDPDSGKNIIAFVDGGDSSKGKAIVINTFNPVSLTTENFIGFAHAAYADGQKATVKTTGSIARNIPQQAQAAAYGSVVQFDAGNLSTGDSNALAFDSSNNKVVLIYRDNGNSNYGTALVGTIDTSDNSISWGSATVFESAAIGGTSLTFDSSNNKVVGFFHDVGDSNVMKGIVGTVSGTSISFGSATNVSTAGTASSAATFDTNSNKVVVAFTDSNNSGYGTARVGTVSGTSISFGTAVVFTSAEANIEADSITFDSSNNRVVVAYTLSSGTNRGNAIVGTVSGTDISFGTQVAFNANFSSAQTATFDTSNNKVVIAFQDSSNSDQGTAVVGTVDSSDNSISFGSEAIFNAAGTDSTSSTFDSTNNTVLVSYRDTGDNNNGTIVVGTVSGTSISFGSENKYTTGGAVNTYNSRIIYDSNAKRAVVIYTEGGASGRGDSRVFSPATNLDLTIGQQYFVQTDGSLGTSADSPSVIAGTAIGTSDLIVKG